MNFFEQQDKTQKTTKKLIVLFSISVFALGCLNYLIVQFYLSTSQSYASVSYVGEPGVHGHQEMHFTLWDPKIFVLTVGITLLVILVVSIIKGLSLRDGGQSVAEMMGGIRIAHDTTNLNEKKLLNVVEEMALASGIPVPDVYILEETGINAFAAGHSIDDAVIGVTRGCIEKLNREELQGVVAHEFSHIFHGDMNINLYLISLLHGILFLHFVGRFLVRSSGSSRRSRNNQGGAIVIGGLVLMVVGYVGYFFGRMIQSAISRQREYLADASAVQYTRNPHGISRALAKIGGFFHPSESHSILQNNKAEQVEHMMFSIAVMPSFFSFFATHPPIEKRITAIDPSFDVLGFQKQTWTQAAAAPVAGAMGFSQGAQTQTDFATPELLMQEQLFIKDLDEKIYKACHHPQRAKALMYLLVIDPAQHNEKSVKDLIQQHDPYLFSFWQELQQALDPKLYEHRIELFDLSMPSLRRLSKQEYKTFSSILLQLVKLDGQVTLAEWIFVELIKTHLHQYFYPKKQAATFTKELDVLEDVRIVFSAVSYAGQESQTDAQIAFEKGFSDFGLPETLMIEKGRLDLNLIAQSFGKLQKCHPRIKKKLIHAIKHIVLSDDQVLWDEFELYRAFADGLGNPIVPFIK